MSTGDRLKSSLALHLGKIEEIRSTEQDRLEGTTWSYWSMVLKVMREDPLDPRTDEVLEQIEDVSDVEDGSGAEQSEAMSRPDEDTNQAENG